MRVNTPVNLCSRRAGLLWVPVALLLMGAAGRLPAQPVTYHIDAGTSTLAFKIKYMGILTVNGVFKEVTGTVFFDPQNPDSMRAELEIQTRSLDTDHSLRDRSLRSDAFLDVERFPRIRFESRRVVFSGNNTDASAATGSYDVQGEIELYGESFPFDFPIQIVPGSKPWDGITILSDFSFRRSDVGLSFDSVMGALIGEEVRIHVEIRAIYRRNDTTRRDNIR